LASTRDRADRVLGWKLTGLVEDDEIEAGRSPVEILGDREWTHEKARLDRAHRSFRLRERAAERRNVALLRHLALDERQPGARRRLLEPLLGGLAKPSDDRGTILFQHTFVERAEYLEPLLVRERAKAAECRSFADHSLQEVFEDRTAKH